MRRVPGVVSVFKADYTFMLGLVVPAVGWGLYLGALMLKPGTEGMFLAVALAFSVFGLPGAWLRWRAVRKLFRQGQECQGEVVSVWLSRDRGRVEFLYQFQGQELQSGMALHRSAAAEALALGQSVQLLVDPDNPRLAVLPQLFS